MAFFKDTWNFMTGASKNVGSYMTGDPGDAMDTMFTQAGSEDPLVKEARLYNIQTEKEKASKFKASSDLYARTFGSAGGSNLQSFTAKSNTKKSILGSF